MGFFRRLFSADYRAAVAAEAGGDFDLAAERYALAGHLESAVRMHLARAERAERRADEITALRDALHWVPEDSDLKPRVTRALGRALLERARAEGIATSRDKDRMREAAAMLSAAGEHRVAGDIYAEVGDDVQAAAAYRKGGLVEKLEEVLGRQEQESDRTRAVRESFADYELHFGGGERDAALRSIRLAVEAADSKDQYRRLLDELESRIIVGGKVVLRTRRGARVTACTGPTVTMGRDALCDMVLRSGGVSRRHAQIEVTKDGAFELVDAGSRNGTKIGGIAIDGAIRLSDHSQFQLGDECTIDCEVHDGWLELAVKSGVDTGAQLLVAGENTWFTVPAIDAQLCFQNGRPVLERGSPGTRLLLNGQKLAHGTVQLIHGDELSIGGIEIDVL